MKCGPRSLNLEGVVLLKTLSLTQKKTKISSRFSDVLGVRFCFLFRYIAILHIPHFLSSGGKTHSIVSVMGTMTVTQARLTRCMVGNGIKR